MRVCFIGNCGHSFQAYHTLKKLDYITFCGTAPGSPHENMSASFFPDVPFFQNYKEMLDTTSPHLAIVSPVFALTGSIILECADRGIDVFAEKPVASSLEELEQVEHAVKNAGIRFSSMHFLRFSPAIYLAGKLVREGAIGQPRLITAQKSYKFGTRPEWYKDRSLYGGTIPWVGIHAMDWISYFTQKHFLAVTALHSGSPEMIALCQFELEDDITASINVDYLRPTTASSHDDDRIRCAGTRGVIEVINKRVTLINDDGTQEYTPTEAPDLTLEFLLGHEPISSEEIFHITRAAITARDAADCGKKLQIKG
ncbi:MAG: Gfo/Idh/MocA family oxidoreductase [Ruminococcaceae bacterium]|nr:Gfo/Idh/MocA family oxidoreductase [Oscillospiraceae bacterium]